LGLGKKGQVVDPAKVIAIDFGTSHHRGRERKAGLQEM
jgi:hypothetical protein